MREKVVLARSLGDMEAEEGAVELEGEDRTVEGVGAHAGGMLEEAQELPGTGVKDQLLHTGELPPGAGQLHDGPAGALGQGLDIGSHLSGIGDKSSTGCRGPGSWGPRPARPTARR